MSSPGSAASRPSAGQEVSCLICDREFGRSDHCRRHVDQFHFKGGLTPRECDAYIKRSKPPKLLVCPGCGVLESVYRLKRTHICTSSNLVAEEAAGNNQNDVPACSQAIVQEPAEEHLQDGQVFICTLKFATVFIVSK